MHPKECWGVILMEHGRDLHITLLLRCAKECGQVRLLHKSQGRVGVPRLLARRSNLSCQSSEFRRCKRHRDL